jgi:methyl-accepting chemotaxis protein
MGMMSVVDTIDGMDQIQEAVEKSAGIVMNLHQRSEEIGRILTVIHEVSEQTELLSLNASILAAQAGENGKGFAVVANEIKALAERTASSTKEITRIIKAVQNEAKEAVESIQIGKEKAEHGKTLSLEAGEALGKILESSRKSAGMAREIERTTVEQSKGITSVRTAVDHINTMIEQFHQAINSQKAGSENVQVATEQISDLTRQVKYAMAEQAKGGRQIGDAVENVLHQVQQIEKAVKGQKGGSELIVKAIDNIRRSTQERVGVSSELDSSIRSLQDQHNVLKEVVSQFKTN